MIIIFFDLGDTLVRQSSTSSYELIPGALKALQEIHSMKDADNNLPIMGLIIDAHRREEAPLSETEKEQKKSWILDILKKTNIKQLFEPIETYVTLSSDIDFTKSQNFKGFIDIALNKVNKNNEYENTVFITEDKEHISLAKSIGIKTIQITNKNNSDLLDDEINALSQLSIKIKKFIEGK